MVAHLYPYSYRLLKHRDKSYKNREEILIKINYFERRYYEIEVGTGKSHSIKNLVLLIKKILNNKKTILNFGSILDNPTEIKNSKANLNSLPKFLNWNPKKNTLEENLKKLLYD